MKRRYIPAKIKTIPDNAQKVFTGEIFDVYQWLQKLYDGSIATFEMLKRPDTAMTIGIIDNQIVITKQRQPHKDWFYSFPGGRADEEDEDELAAAKREMLEEAGLEFADWKLVAVKQNVNKIDWLVYTFVAQNPISETSIKPDAGEEIQVMRMDFKDAKALANLVDNERKFSIIAKAKDIEEIKNLPDLYTQ